MGAAGGEGADYVRFSLLCQGLWSTAVLLFYCSVAGAAEESNCELVVENK